jgi:hypothetical protein
MLDFEGELAKAVKYFWQVRGRQKKRQGGKSGKKDAGERSSVTGGKHADGFIRLIAAIVKDAALPKVEIHVTEKKPRTLPGFYRPCKEWDLVVLSADTLVAVVEVKSQVGSFGNNFNNRVEEAPRERDRFLGRIPRGDIQALAEALARIPVYVGRARSIDPGYETD